MASIAAATLSEAANDHDPEPHARDAQHTGFGRQRNARDCEASVSWTQVTRPSALRKVLRRAEGGLRLLEDAWRRRWAFTAWVVGIRFTGLHLSEHETNYS